MATNPLILIVENNRVIQDTVRVDIERIGYKVLSALTTEEAWKLLEEGTIPDVMVLGFYFPGDDGPAFFRRLKRDPRFLEMPVVPLMGHAQQKPQKPQAIVINSWQEGIDKTPPELLLLIKQELRKKTGKTTNLRRVWAGIEKQFSKLRLRR